MELRCYGDAAGVFHGHDHLHRLVLSVSLFVWGYGVDLGVQRGDRGALGYDLRLGMGGVALAGVGPYAVLGGGGRLGHHALVPVVAQGLVVALGLIAAAGARPVVNAVMLAVRLAFVRFAGEAVAQRAYILRLHLLAAAACARARAALGAGGGFGHRPGRPVVSQRGRGLLKDHFIA